MLYVNVGSVVIYNDVASLESSTTVMGAFAVFALDSL
jgi:hypothetical protein